MSETTENKPKLPNPTFKRVARETGLRSVGQGHRGLEIKKSGIQVGEIYLIKENPYVKIPTEFIGKFAIMLYTPGVGRNVTLKAKFDTEEAALEFLKKNWIVINSKFDLKTD